MRNPSKNIFIIFCTLISIFVLFYHSQAQIKSDQEKTETPNLGYLEFKDITETKKRTVKFYPEFSSEIHKGKYKLTALQALARDYRQQGLDCQKRGDLDSAMAFYQKAKELDPSYAVVYNDLGIIYETKGWATEAEESYLKAIALDPYYLSPYSNLALLYEEKGDLKKAAYYWQKRIELDFYESPFLSKAKERLSQIQQTLSGARLEQKPKAKTSFEPKVELSQQMKEKPKDQLEPKQEGISGSTSLGLTEEEKPKEKLEPKKELSSKEELAVKPVETTKSDRIAMAEQYLKQAEAKYKNKEYLAAYLDASQAQVLDPTNQKAAELVEELQKRLLAE